MKQGLILILGIMTLLFGSSVYAIVGLPDTQDIAYNPDEPTAVLDWYNPTTTGATCNGTTPIYIFAHGGGFTSGNETISPSVDPYKTLLRNCYAIASVRYPLALTSTFKTNPTQFMSLVRAVQYFRKNDTNYNINEVKVIAAGQSAGADIWMNPVYGPSYTGTGGDLNTQDGRPNYFVSISGWTDINAMINTTTGAYFGTNTLTTVSSADKNAASLIFMLDTNGTLFPERVIPTLFISNGPAQTTFPILDPHDHYFGILGLQKINQYKPGTGSQDTNLLIFADETDTIMNWLNAQVGSALSTPPSPLYFTDFFDGYEGDWNMFWDFNTLSGYTLGGDFNTGVSGGTGRISNDSVNWVVDVDKNAVNMSSFYRALTPVITYLRDANALGARNYMLWKTDNNSNLTNMKVRMGQGNSNYWEWTLTPSTDIQGSWQNGWNISEFDNNSPTATVGVPSLVDINFLYVEVNYGAGQADFNFWIDQLWTELPPGVYGDTWLPQKSGTIIYGQSVPRKKFGTYALGLGNNNSLNSQTKGIILQPFADEYNTNLYDFNIVVDFNQMDINGYSKILFDYVNPTNYSSCYTRLQSSDGTSFVGVEKVTNGVVDGNETGTTYALQSIRTITCLRTDGNVSAYVLGLEKMSKVLTKVDGSFGLMSDGQFTRYGNYYNTLSLSDPPDPNEGKVELGEGTTLTFDFFRDVLFPILLMALLVIALFAALKSGDIKVFVGGAIVVIITYLLWNNLFF